MTIFDRRFAVIFFLTMVLTAGTVLAQAPATKAKPAAKPQPAATEAKPGAAQASGPFATKAVVEVKSDGKVIQLKREEQIAFMFVDAIHSLQGNCGMGSAEPCTLAALIRGPKKKDDFGVGKLKFDPNATDPNYTYKVALKDADWEIWATPKKSGLGAFYAKGKFFGGIYYKADGGTASAADSKLDGTSVSGDLFYKLFES